MRGLPSGCGACIPLRSSPKEPTLGPSRQEFAFAYDSATRMEHYPGMAVAATDSEIVFLGMAKISGLWYDEKYRKFFENLCTIVSEYVPYCWRKISIVSCRKTEDRFMLYLNRYASEVGEDDVTIPFPRVEDCARSLGVTRVSLSQAISDLV